MDRWLREEEETDQTSEENNAHILCRKLSSSDTVTVVGTLY